MPISQSQGWSRCAPVLAACFLAGCLQGAPARGAALPHAWATGAELVERLRTPLSASWSNLPLSRALASLAATQRVAVVLDRRIDPGQPITLVISQQPLAAALAMIARRVNAGYSQLGPVAYLGPPHAAGRLRTLAALHLEDTRVLPPAAARKFLVIRDWAWDDLAEPRSLVNQLAAEAGIKIESADKIPHDLWPAAHWPPLTWIDRLTLLTAQFDLTFRVDKTGGRVELVAVPEKVAIARTYRAGRDASAVARRWAKAVPAAKVAIEQNAIRVEGLVEDHELVERRLRGTPNERTTVTAGQEVYQLSVEKAALAQVVEQLAGRLSLRFEWDRPAIDAAGISVDQLVSVKVQNVGLDDLIRAILKDTGLAFRREAQTVTIFPAPAGKASP